MTKICLTERSMNLIMEVSPCLKGLEKDTSERCGNLDKTDENLLSIIRKFENDNNSQIGGLKSDFIASKSGFSAEFIAEIVLSDVS